MRFDGWLFNDFKLDGDFRHFYLFARQGIASKEANITVISSATRRRPVLSSRINMMTPGKPKIQPPL